MTFEVGLRVEHDAFSTLGPTPKVEGWLNVRRANASYDMLRKGFSLALGFAPLRFAWQGRWRIHP